MKVVIRVKDGIDSFFCGFKNDAFGISGVLLSRAKANAKIYANLDEAQQDLLKIIRVTEHQLLGSVQMLEAAPDIIEVKNGEI